MCALKMLLSMDELDLLILSQAMRSLLCCCQQKMKTGGSAEEETSTCSRSAIKAHLSLRLGFYRTHVHMGSDHWVALSVTTYVQDLFETL